VDSATRTRLQQEWVRLGVEKLRDTNLALVAMGKIDHAEAEVLLWYSGTLYSSFSKLFSPNTKEEISTALLYKGAVSAVNALEPFTGSIYFGQKLPQSYIDSELRPGGIFSNNNFTSTSKFLSIGKEFASPHIPNTAESTSVVFYVEKSCHGRDISAFSAFAVEAEVIFQALHPFRVVERTQSPDGRIQNVKLEEVIPCPAQKPSPRKLSRASCVLKNSGNGFRIYASENGGPVIGVLKPGQEILTYATVNSRYEMVTPFEVPLENQECTDTLCLRKKIVAGKGNPTSIEGVTGAEIFSTKSAKGAGFLAIGAELLGQNLDMKRNKTDRTVYVHAFIDQGDVDSCTKDMGTHSDPL
jgi:hypothetical protein